MRLAGVRAPFGVDVDERPHDDFIPTGGPLAHGMLCQDVPLPPGVQLPAQLTDLGALLGRRRTRGLFAGLVHPAPQRRVVDPQLPGDLGEVARGGLNHLHDIGLESGVNFRQFLAVITDSFYARRRNIRCPSNRGNTRLPTRVRHRVELLGAGP
jgi:hypothetical protein